MELLQILIFAAALSVEKQPLRRVDQMDKNRQNRLNKSKVVHQVHSKFFGCV
jgi:hypothetical protein